MSQRRRIRGSRGDGRCVGDGEGPGRSGWRRRRRVRWKLEPGKVEDKDVPYVDGSVAVQISARVCGRRRHLAASGEADHACPEETGCCDPGSLSIYHWKCPGASNIRPSPAGWTSEGFPRKGAIGIGIVPVTIENRVACVNKSPKSTPACSREKSTIAYVMFRAAPHGGLHGGRN